MKYIPIQLDVLDSGTSTIDRILVALLARHWHNVVTRFYFPSGFLYYRPANLPAKEPQIQ